MFNYTNNYKYIYAPAVANVWFQEVFLIADKRYTEVSKVTCEFTLGYLYLYALRSQMTLDTSVYFWPFSIMSVAFKVLVTVYSW